MACLCVYVCVCKSKHQRPVLCTNRVMRTICLALVCSRLRCKWALQSANIQQLSDINTHVQSMLLLMLQISKITATVCNLWCQSNDCLEGPGLHLLVVSCRLQSDLGEIAYQSVIQSGQVGNCMQSVCDSMEINSDKQAQIHHHLYTQKCTLTIYIKTPARNL